MARRPRFPKSTKADLDPEILSVVLTVMRVGAGKTEAARQAGISLDTLKNYELRGAKALTVPEAERSRSEKRFAQFAIEYAKSQGHVKVYMLGLIARAAKKEWRAGAWLLEKQFPQEYGQHVQVGGEIETAVSVDLTGLTLDELKTLKTIRAKLTPTEGNEDEKQQEEGDE